ncbi:TetR/AcrR family transcriptional regulator [Mycobacterium sp. ACS1612]|uniref:TetR/AcrR family transcriptional regulator n=1 Tax=Mycobacterium sp. ACS1612 TaxID=1834117 RepID=UPI0035171D35
MMTAGHPHTGRARRATRPSGDDRELAILSTLERLLADRVFSDISVDDLAKGAGISRPTFYFYFSSKDAVLLTVFERVLAEADAAFGGDVTDYSVDPTSAWRSGIFGFFEPLRENLPVVLAGVAATSTNAEIREMWSRFMQNWVDRTAAVITAERARGAAPETVPAQDLAAALNLMNERTMFASYTGQTPAIAEDAALDTLAHIWITSIYGRAP